MKKSILLAAILAASSSLAFAEEVNNNFTGAGIGLELGSTKYSDYEDEGENISLKRMTDVNLVGSYGFAFGDTDWVGQAELKYKLNSSKLVDDEDGEIKLKRTWSVGYLQGYRVTPNIMPYVKLAYASSKVKDKVSNKLNGMAYGLGAKFIVAPHVEIGTEYLHSRMKAKDCDSDDCTFNSNSFNLGVTYRF